MNGMRTLRIQRDRVSRTALSEAVRVLRSGRVVVFPTETAYGLAADPFSREAVAAIYAIKGRTNDKKLPLIAADLRQAAAVVRLIGPARRLALRHWPGALTIVAPVRSGRRPVGAGARGATVAVRVPALAWARALAREFGAPLTSTSANLSGQPACYSPREVRKQLVARRRQPELFLNAGALPRRPPSTIVKIVKGQVVILRPGSIKLAESH
ncbi:MAG: L-threonylcarbamoyladenylate synthase [Patescibacteria group bacterium]|jgi:L-threonylcarbamoyladenylate synthase